MTERILAVAAHPDDEILGVGGTLARYAAANVPVKTLILGEGATSRSTDPVDTACQFEVSALVHASNQAANVLGCLPPTHLGLPDNNGELEEYSGLIICKNVYGLFNNFSRSVVSE